MEPSLLLIVLICIVAFEYVLNLVLSIVNDNARKLSLPEEAKGIYDEEKYSKSMQYGRENSRFSYFSSTFSFVLTCLVLIGGFFGWLDGMLVVQFENELMAALIFFGVLFVASDLLNLPFQLYDTFVIEEKYGFNKTTAAIFVKDKLKSYLLTVLIGGGLIYLFLVLVGGFRPGGWGGGGGPAGRPPPPRTAGQPGRGSAPATQRNAVVSVPLGLLPASPAQPGTPREARPDGARRPIPPPPRRGT
jgi:STE24 endopeptidase